MHKAEFCTVMQITYVDSSKKTIFRVYHISLQFIAIWWTCKNVHDIGTKSNETPVIDWMNTIRYLRIFIWFPSFDTINIIIATILSQFHQLTQQNWEYSVVFMVEIYAWDLNLNAVLKNPFFMSKPWKTSEHYPIIT